MAETLMAGLILIEVFFIQLAKLFNLPAKLKYYILQKYDKQSIKKP